MLIPLLKRLYSERNELRKRLSELKKKYAENFKCGIPTYDISKRCDSVTFMYLLMATKLCGDPLLTYTIVAKVSDEMSYLPRELLVLLDLLEEQQQSAALSPEQQTKIDAVAAAMPQPRRAEGRVSPHLAALRERLLSEPGLS